MAAPPEPSLVATLGSAVEPLIHAPEAVQAARVGGVRMIDDAVLQRERAHAGPLSPEGRPVGADAGGDLGADAVRVDLERRLLVGLLEVVLGHAPALLLLGDPRLEVVVELAAERRGPGEA